MPMGALLRCRLQPRIVWHSMASPGQLFSDFKHNQKRLLALEQMDKCHPRILPQCDRFKVCKKDACNAYVLATVSFPKSGHDFGQRSLSRSMRQHPRGDLPQVGEGRSDMESEPASGHGYVGSWLVGKIAHALRVGLFEEFKAFPLGFELRS